MADDVVELDDAGFAAAIAGGVALVDFYGAWCPPCRLLEPVIARVAERYRGRALVARVNVDENSEAAVEHSIADIPTLVVFKDGREAGRLFGAQSEENVIALLDRALQEF